MNALEKYILWAVLAAGIAGVAFGFAQTALARPAGGRPKYALGYFIWPNAISGILAAAAAAALFFSGRIPEAWALRIPLGLALGWAALFLVFAASRSNGRKLASDVPVADSEGQSLAGYGLISASGMVSYAAPLAAMAVMVLLLPFSPIEESLSTEALLAAAVGFWVAASFWSVPTALFRGVLTQADEAAPTELGSLCARFKSVSGETAFLTATALALAVAMGGFRFPEGRQSGTVFALGSLAASLIFGMLVNPLLRPAGGGRSASLRQAVGLVIFLLGTAAAAFYLSSSFLGDRNGFYCFATGLATAMLLMFTARYRPPCVSPGSPFGLEIAVAQALLLLGAELLAFRWMGGYGVSVCTIGLFASFAVLFPLGALWAINRADSETGEAADLPFISHAATRFAEIVTAGGAFLLLVGLLRLFYERQGRMSVDITDPYPLIGLVVGASFPVLLRAVALSGLAGRHAGSFEKGALIGLGRWAAFRTLGLWLIAAASPLLLALFWRLQSCGAFLVGLAAAELFLILTLWLGEVRNEADDALRFATKSTHILSVGSALVTVLLSPLVVEATALITRTQKIYVLAGVLLVVFAWVFTVVLRRLKLQPG